MKNSVVMLYFTCDYCGKEKEVPAPMSDEGKGFELPVGWIGFEGHVEKHASSASCNSEGIYLHVCCRKCLFAALEKLHV